VLEFENAGDNGNGSDPPPDFGTVTEAVKVTDWFTVEVLLAEDEVTATLVPPWPTVNVYLWFPVRLFPSVAVTVKVKLPTTGEPDRIPDALPNVSHEGRPVELYV
jgi:hypothetical protein